MSERSMSAMSVVGTRPICVPRFDRRRRCLPRRSGVRRGSLVVGQLRDGLNEVHVVAVAVGFGQRQGFAVRFGGELLRPHVGHPHLQGAVPAFTHTPTVLASSLCRCSHSSSVACNVTAMKVLVTGFSGRGRWVMPV